MPTNTLGPSGQMPSGQWVLIDTVSGPEFDAASAALDRALLRKIGLPEEVEVRAFENAVVEMANKIVDMLYDFSLAKLIGILPILVLDATALWTKLEPKLKGKIERKEFITKVIQYVYRKNNPDLPYLVEPFETMVENMILDAVPELLDNLEKKLAELVVKLGLFFR